MIEQPVVEQHPSHFKEVPTKDLILEEAYAMMCLSGIKKLSMEELAQRVGLSRAAIYLHFKDRHQLIMLVMKKMGMKDLDALREIAHEKGSATEKLRHCLRSHVMLKINRCRTNSISTDELFGDFRQAYLEFRKEMILKTAGVLTEILVEGKINGEFEFENAFESAESLIMMIQGFMPFSLTNEELGDTNLLQDRLDRVIELGIKTLLPAQIQKSAKLQPKRSLAHSRKNKQLKN